MIKYAIHMETMAMECWTFFGLHSKGRVVFGVWDITEKNKEDDVLY